MEEPNDTSHSAGCCDWQKTVEDFSERTQKFVREDPSKAVGLALLAGALLTALPIGRVLAGLTRLAFSLLRPTLLLFGVVKLYEEFQKTQKR